MAIRPVVWSMENGTIIFCFEGITKAIYGNVSQGEITIAVEAYGRFWDVILWLDFAPVRVEGGWECRLCLPESRSIFPTRAALWRSDIFDPLTHWINETLAFGELLVMRTDGDGSSRARIVPGNQKVPENGGRTISLRPRSHGSGSSVRGIFASLSRSEDSRK